MHDLAKQAVILASVQDGYRATTCPRCSGRATLEVFQVQTAAGRIRRYLVRCWNDGGPIAKRCRKAVTDRPLDDVEPPVFPGPPKRCIDAPPLLTVKKSSSVRRCPFCNDPMSPRKRHQKYCSRRCSIDARHAQRLADKAAEGAA